MQTSILDRVFHFQPTILMKERILDEIKRLAAKNNGKAPGRRFFEKATGIPERDWYGKIWVRWSDAITESGLRPNKKNERLSADVVLDRYAEVCRHYGKPPTAAELKLYARNHADFIGHNTFTNHFGNKENLIKALRDRSVERGEFDLIKILPEAEFVPSESNPDTQIHEGWVYLLRSGNHYKIGRSDELEKRIKQISVALPETAELIHAIRTDDPSGVETYWHRRFAEQRANGEWFKLTKENVRAFKRRKFQ